MSRAWNPEDHPRHPAKAPGGKGGEFRDAGGTPDWADQLLARLTGAPTAPATGPLTRAQVYRALDEMSAEVDALPTKDKKKVEATLHRVRRDVVTMGAGAGSLQDYRPTPEGRATVQAVTDLLNRGRDPRYPGSMLTDLFKIEDRADAIRYWQSLSPELQQSLAMHLADRGGFEGTVAGILARRRDEQEYAQWRGIVDGEP